MSEPILSAALDVERLRADFPILQTILRGREPLAYLDNAASTQRPRQVIDAIVHCFEHEYANVHRGIHWLSERSTDRFEQRASGCDNSLAPRQWKKSSSPTAPRKASTSWPAPGATRIYGPAMKCFSRRLEHHANIVPWQQLAERRGITLRWAPIDDRGCLVLDALDELLTDRTRLVAVTAVSNVLGVENPVAEIVARAHAVGALALVDAAQSVPHQVTDVRCSAPTFSPSADTRCSVPREWECSMAGASCSKPCRLFWAEAA